MISCIRLLLVSLFIFSLVVAGCSAKPPDIQFSDIVVIPEPVMKGVVSVFMRIKNNGGKDNLTGVRTDIDGTIAELHDVRDGRMVKVKDRYRHTFGREGRDDTGGNAYHDFQPS
jgi:copper(I)-binding protein